MLHLIGVNHGWQISKTDTSRFQEYLEQQINELKIKCVAEELSVEALGGNKSTAKIICEKLEVQHLFCDPDTAQRERIGLKPEQWKDSAIAAALDLPGNSWSEEDLKKIDNEKRKYFFKRENFWLHRIEQFKQNNLIFVCGKQHLESFSDALKKAGFSVNILDPHEYGEYPRISSSES